MQPEIVKLLKTMRKQATAQIAAIDALLVVDNKQVIKKPEVVNYTPWDMEQAKYLWELCHANMSYLKPPKSFGKWADEIRRLRETDGYAQVIIVAVIEWCQNDKFWRTNIRSAGKLREKFETLLAAIQRQREGSSLI